MSSHENKGTTIKNRLKSMGIFVMFILLIIGFVSLVNKNRELQSLESVVRSKSDTISTQRLKLNLFMDSIKTLATDLDNSRSELAALDSALHESELVLTRMLKANSILNQTKRVLNDSLVHMNQYYSAQIHKQKTKLNNLRAESSLREQHILELETKVRLDSFKLTYLESRLDSLESFRASDMINTSSKDTLIELYSRGSFTSIELQDINGYSLSSLRGRKIEKWQRTVVVVSIKNDSVPLTRTQFFLQIYDLDNNQPLASLEKYGTENDEDVGFYLDYGIQKQVAHVNYEKKPISNYELRVFFRNQDGAKIILPQLSYTFVRGVDIVMPKDD